MSSKKLIELRTLFLATSMLTAGAAGAAQAQDQSAETVVVTGSHISTPGFTAPTPVTSVSSADLQVQATTQVDQMEYQIPQLVPNNAVQGTSATGQSYLNLRGLGPTRTLMLMDGRRVAPTSYDGTTDANIIPTSLIKSVNVVTGGASAAYGSDALSGVVNFTLDDTFEGLKGSFQTGESQYHDNKDLDLSMTGGFSFDGGRGHVVVSGEAFSNSGASGNIEMTGGVARRPYANQGYAQIPGGAGFPAQIDPANVKFSSMTNGGLITSGPLKGIYFGPNAALETMVYGTNISATYMVGGSGDQSQLYGSISPELGRESLFTHVSYDLTPDLEAWGQLLIVHETAFSPNVPNYDNNTLTIKNDNPFIPTAVKTLMTTNNLTQFTFGRLDPELGLGESQEYVYDVMWDAGLKGKMFGNWAWDLTAQYNSNQWNFKYLNERNNALWSQAIDVTSNPAAGGVTGVAVGAPICRSTLAAPTNGCVPVNLFGVNSITPAMAAYVGGHSTDTAPQQAWDITGNVSGILLQDWAGDVSVATGFEVRRDSVHMTADAVSIAKQWRAYNLPPFTGNYQVEEGYLETDIPLLKNVPFAQDMGLNAAGRVTNYSNFGTVETWKIGIDNQVDDDLRMRANYSSDIRAPTLNDLYAAAGTNQGQFFNNNTKQTQTLITATGGNPNLQPEQATTFTGGFVYSPGWLEGFQGSLDYYTIHLHNGIQTTTAQQQVDSCQLYHIAAACAEITSNAAGLITNVFVTPLNVANTQMDGVDTELSYTFSGDAIWNKLDGNFRVRALGTYVDSIASTSSAGVVCNQVMQGVSCGAGVSSYIPKWVAVASINYTTEKWNFLLDYRYTGALRYSNTYVQGVDIDNNHIGSRYYFNASAQYQIFDNWQVYTRVANLFNVSPPVNPSNNLIVPTTSVAQAYDRIGRQYYAGFRFNF